MFTSRRSTRLTVGRVLAALSRCSMTDNDEHGKEGAALLSADCSTLSTRLALGPSQST